MNSIFHPPECFTNEGGEEEFYQKQLQELVNGVDLNTSANDDQECMIDMANLNQQLDPDGIEMANTTAPVD